jgi:hypothetical protein
MNCRVCFLLRNIANESLFSHEEACFRSIRDHRNKLVHFFHRTYAAPIGPNVLAEIVSIQCKAWFFLHRLLTVRWAPYFGRYAKQVAHLARLVQGNRQFLSSKFKALQPEIQVERKKGSRFENCAVCGFEAAQILMDGALRCRNCLVCDSYNHFLSVECPDCKTSVVTEPEDRGTCSNCGASVSLDYLIRKLGPREDPKGESSIAYCCYCEQHHDTVVPWGNDDYLCLNCLGLHDDLGRCGWCGDLITGGTKDTSLTGCFRCPGPNLGRDRTLSQRSWAGMDKIRQ